MTNEELKRALFSKEPVIFMGTQYDHVSAIIYRVDKKGLYITGELTDSNQRSVTIAHAEKIEAVRP